MMQALGRLWLTDLMGLGDTEKSDRSLSNLSLALCRV
jgi:predicted GTPase